MDSNNQASRPQAGANATYAALLEVTVAMRDALTAQEIERFTALVDRREAIIAALGQRRPASDEERDCLRQAAALDAQVREAAELTWRRTIGDLTKLMNGKQANAAYFRTMLAADPKDSSHFIDKTK
ncbi:MAG: hypothetical protein ACM3XN_07660 [Chloroflexota bacterium]